MGMMIKRHPFFFRPEDCGTMMPLSAATLMVHGFPLESYGLLAHSKDGLLYMSGKEKPDGTQPSKKVVSGWR